MAPELLCGDAEKLNQPRALDVYRCVQQWNLGALTGCIKACTSEPGFHASRRWQQMGSARKDMLALTGCMH